MDKKLKKLKKDLEQAKIEMAALRDRLRDIADDAGDLENSCESALDDLESCVDHISELV